MRGILLAIVACFFCFSSRAVNYYSGATGNLDNVNSWWSNMDGTGTHPPDFTTLDQVFNIINNSASTIGANWTVSGTGSKIVVGNSSFTCNFTIPSSFAVTGTIDVTANAMLTITNTVIPTFGVLSTGSTVKYNHSGGGQTITGATYSNLIIGNTSGTQTAGGDITVTDALTTTSNGTLSMSTYQLLGVASVTNNGTISTLCTANPAIPADKNWSGTKGIILYNATTGRQYIPAGTYKTLNCTHTSDTDRVTGAITVTTSLKTSAAGGTLDMGTNLLSASSATITNTGALATQNTSSSPLPSDITWVGTVIYNGTGDQTMVTGTFKNLVLSGARVSTPTITLPSGNISLSGSFSAPYTGNVTFANTDNNFIYTGNTAQTAGGIDYNNLAFTNTSSTKTATGNMSVSGALSIASGGKLIMNTYQLSGTPTSVTNNGTITTNCTLNPALPAGYDWSGTTGIVTFGTLTGRQYIPAGSYKTLTCSNTSDTNFVVGGDIDVSAVFTTSGIGGVLDMGANVVTGTTITNKGTILTQNTSSAPLPADRNWAGTICYNGTGNQTIVAGTYANVELGGNRVSTPVITLPADTITVSGNFNVYYTGTVSFANAGNTFIYTFNSAKTVGGIAYNNLILAHTALTKTAGGDIEVDSALITSSGGTLAMGPYQLTGAMTSLTNDGTITTASTANPAIPAGKNWSGITGQITFAATTGGQYIPAGTYNNLTCSNTSDTNIVTGNIVVSGTITTSGSGGSLDMGIYDLSGGSVIIANNSSSLLLTQSVSSAPLPSGINITTSGTVVYNALSGGQTIVTGTYKNLTLANTSGTDVAGGDLVVNSALTTSGGTLDMSSYMLSGAALLPAGSGTILTANASATPIKAGKTWPQLIIYNNDTGGQSIVAGTYSGGLTNSNTSGINTVVSGASITINGDLTLSAGSELSDNNVTVTLNGNILGTGTHDVSASGKISMNDGGTISGAMLGNLRLNDALNFSLTGSPTMNGTLTFSAGTLSLNNYNLIISATAPDIAGTFSSSKMIIINGSGEVRKMLDSNDTFLYPIGDTSGNYTPITLSFTGGSYGANAYAAARVINQHHANDASTTDHINRYWSIATHNITSPVYDVTSAKYADTDVAGSESNISSAVYSGSLPWVKYGAVTAGSNTISASNVTSTNADITGILRADPTVSVLPADTSFCNGGSANLNATGGGIAPLTYTWSPATGLSATTGQSVTATPTTGTVSATYVYTVTITDGNGITSTNTATVQVFPLPAAITGSNGVCIDAATTLSDETPSGTWASSNGSAASVGSSDGIVTGIATGTTTISYTDTNGCVSTLEMTVNPLPEVDAITGTFDVCQFNSTTLNDAVSGGTWSSSADGVASVGTTGSVSGVTAGTADISYSVTDGHGCTSAVAQTVTVNPAPYAAMITGPASVCVDASIVLSDSTAGGIWISTDTSATIDSSGTVTGISGDGSTDIQYVATNSCGTDTAVATITVYALPTTGTIAYTNNHKACTGEQWLYTSTHTDGFWSTSDTSVASIDSSGLLTAIDAGSITVSYTVTNIHGCSKSRLTGLTVVPLPAVSPISGISDLCIGNTITLTDASTTGTHTWVSADGGTATITSGSGIVTGIAPGTVTISYNYTVLGCTNSATAVVTVNASAAPIVGGSNTVCEGGTVTLVADSTGGVWYTADVTEVNVDSTTGVVTGLTPGVAIVTYAFTNSYGCAQTTLRTLTVNPHPSVTTIGGVASVCAGATSTLTDGTTGGTWSSANTGIATIGTAGIVTGVSDGTAVISYTVTDSNGCNNSATKTVTINALPDVATIDAGTGNTCEGATAIMTNASGGSHLWSSDNTGVATINAASGILTGIAGGTATISYRYTSGCTNYATTVITINPVTTASVSGTSTICSGSSMTFTGLPAGGTWSSSSVSRAAVGSTGLVTGGVTGPVTITYAYTNGYGCVSTAAIAVTVNPKPSVATIGGVSSVCEDAATTMTDATADGAWSSSNTVVGSIEETTGLLTGIFGGTTTISYTDVGANGCSKTVTKALTVNASPAISAIMAGSGTVCVGTTLSLTDTTAGSHQWTSDDTDIATINLSSGMVTGIASGTATISYKYTLGCSAYVETVVTVNPVMAPSISGTLSVCSDGGTTTLTGIPGGGSWASSSAVRATVDASGIVTGGANGTLTISYTYTNGYGCAAMDTKTVTVNSLPSVASISGASGVCQDNVTILGDATAGGVWSSSGTGIATVGTDGAVTGISPGTVYISYTVTNEAGCGKSALKMVTVNALPDVAPISAGTGEVDEEATLTLTDSSAGTHMWSSANTAIATIDASSGLLTGIGTGTVTISYAYTSGCTGYATTVITVNPVGGGKAETIQNAADAFIQIYPNPTSGAFNINASSSGYMVLSSLEGKIIARYDVMAGTNTFNLPSGIAAGIYTCIFKGGNNKQAVKLIYEQ